MADFTEILLKLESGDQAAADQLLPLVYDELRSLAASKLAQEKPGQTLQGTALVHEAYLRLAGENRHEPWKGRRQFFAAAAEAMRRILVENARKKKSLKRGGGAGRQNSNLDEFEAKRPAAEVLALHDALEELAEIDPLRAELVKLRYFVGLTIPDAADILGISSSSVDRQWSYARAWLHQRVAQPGHQSKSVDF